ncbi:MAG: ABC transporter permease [Clostridia bacterium]|nr:ABC transporter permease [Clostridia bacterium]
MKKSKLLLALTLLTYVFLIGPMAVMIATSFSASASLSFPPTGFSFQWYQKAFASPSFQRGFVTSLTVSLGGTLLAMLLGIPAAYAMNKYRFPGKALINGFFISPTLIPALVLGFSLLRSFIPRIGGSIYTGLFVGYTLIAIPYIIRTTSSALANFDFSIEEAARSLGAGAVGGFFLSVLPNIRSGLMSAFILAFINSFNDVSIGVFVTSPGTMTLPTAMMGYIQGRMDPTIAAASVLLMAMTMLLMVLSERLLGVKLRR